MKRTLGIDLGTTNCVVASNGCVLPLVDGSGSALLMPSVLAFPPGGGALVGSAARERRGIDPKNTLFSTKRLMGESWHSYAVRQFREQYPHELSQSVRGVELITRAGSVSPEEVASVLAAHLCMRAQVRPGDEPVVVTVPSSFRDSARRATLAAAARAGFGQLRLIEEPVATAIAYLQRSSLRYAAVYDFGGGTFDFAIIDCSSHPFRVLGHAGDPYLGGDDVDVALAHLIASQVLRRYGWDLCSEPLTFTRLTLMAEHVKRQLASEPLVEVKISAIDPAAPTTMGSVTIERAMLEDVAMPFVQRTFGLCDEVLQAVSLKARDIQAVFLAGGSTRLPTLGERVSQYFGRRVRTDLMPEHVVAIGASLAAARPELWSLLALD